MRRFRCVKILEIREEVFDQYLQRMTAVDPPLRVLPGMELTAYDGGQYLRVTKPPYIHLECSDIMWIEVLPEILAEFFEEVFY